MFKPIFKAGCTCPSGTMWDEAVNKCVTEKECKGCPSGSTWNNCGSACQPTCQNPLIPDDCTKQCVGTCECDDACMVINEENGQCTNVKQCPKANTGKCGISFQEHKTTCKLSNIFEFIVEWIYSAWKIVGALLS